MSGYLDATTLARLHAGEITVRTTLLVYFDEGVKGYINEAGSFTINGQIYSGNCAIGEVSGIDGGISMEAGQPTISLSAVDAEILSDFTTKTWHIRRAVIADYSFDPALRTVDPTPIEYYPCLIGNAYWPQKSGEVAEIRLELVDLLEQSFRGSSAFRTNGDQRRRLSTDTILSRVDKVHLPRDIFWGRRQASNGNAVVRGLPSTKR